MLYQLSYARKIKKPGVIARLPACGGTRLLQLISLPSLLPAFSCSTLESKIMLGYELKIVN